MKETLGGPWGNRGDGRAGGGRKRKALRKMPKTNFLPGRFALHKAGCQEDSVLLLLELNTKWQGSSYSHTYGKP